MLNRELTRNFRLLKGQTFIAKGRTYRILEAHYYTCGGEWAMEDSYYVFKEVNKEKLYKFPAQEIEDRVEAGIITFPNENKRTNFRRTSVHRS